MSASADSCYHCQDGYYNEYNFSGGGTVGGACTACASEEYLCYNKNAGYVASNKACSVRGAIANSCTGTCGGNSLQCVTAGDTNTPWACEDGYFLESLSNCRSKCFRSLGYLISLRLPCFMCHLYRRYRVG